MQIENASGGTKTATEKNREVRPREVERREGPFGHTNLPHKGAEAQMSTQGAKANLRYIRSTPNYANQRSVSRSYNKYAN